jgi:hypothetical protein
MDRRSQDRILADFRAQKIASQSLDPSASQHLPVHLRFVQAPNSS